MQPSPEKNKQEQTIDALCNHCGQTFSAFLHQMQEQNAKVVVCPSCGKVHDFSHPAKAVKDTPRKH